MDATIYYETTRNSKQHSFMSCSKGATVQQIQAIQDIVIICPKQQHDILYTPKEQAIGI